MEGSIKCPGCGKLLASTVTTCPFCSASITNDTQSDTQQEYSYQPTGFSQPNNGFSQSTGFSQPNNDFTQNADGFAHNNEPPKPFNEFVSDNRGLKSVREVKTVGILCYILAVINVVAVLINLSDSRAEFSVLYFLDAAIILALGLGIHLKYSMICSILLLALGAYEVIYGLVTTGQFSGWLIPIAGVLALINVIKLKKEYTQYVNDINRRNNGM